MSESIDVHNRFPLSIHPQLLPLQTGKSQCSWAVERIGPTFESPGSLTQPQLASEVGAITLSAVTLRQAGGGKPQLGLCAQPMAGRSGHQIHHLPSPCKTLRHLVAN